MSTLAEKRAPLAEPVPGEIGGSPKPGNLVVWIAAIRPATLTAAVGPVLVGTALAQAAQVLRPLVALAALVGALLIQIGTNLFNDYADFEKGADTADRLGPARATQKGWLTPRQVLAGSIGALAAAFAVGIYLVTVGGWPIVAIGLASLACAVLYTGGPYPLAYTGLGDLFVFLFFGLVAVGGTYYLQAEAVSADALWAGAALGLLGTAILVVNNLRDRHGDAAAAKRTLVVRFGARFGRGEYVAVVLGAYALLGVAVALGHASPGWLLPMISLPLALRRVRAIYTKDGRALNPELGATAKLGFLFSVLLAIGAIL